MAPRLPNPLGGLTDLPSDLLEALRHLPDIAESTRAMREHTEALVKIGNTMEQVARDTQALPELQASMDRVAAATELLQPMDHRMAAIAEAMPVLVEVQTHLARMPQTIERLDGHLDVLSDRVSGLLASLEEVAGQLPELQTGMVELKEGMEPIGRMAKRFPGRQKAD